VYEKIQHWGLGCIKTQEGAKMQVGDLVQWHNKPHLWAIVLDTSRKLPNGKGSIKIIWIKSREGFEISSSFWAHESTLVPFSIGDNIDE
jgi:hypothetical protein